MQINISYFNSGFTLPAGFTAAINYVVNFFDNLFTNNVTENIEVGYGKYDGGASIGPGSAVENDFNLANGDSNNVLLYDYATVRQALISHATSASDLAAVATLPLSDPLGSGDDIYVQPSEARALGLAAGTGNGGIDAYIGFGLPQNGVPYDFDPNNRAIAGEADFIGIAMHEISHALGRVSLVGIANEFSLADLFRYSGISTRQEGNHVPAYFSIDAGVTDLKDWSTTSDQGDWANGTQNGGSYVPDAGNAFYAISVKNDFTAVDKTEMDVIGWTLSPPPPPPPPPPLPPGPPGHVRHVLAAGDFNGDHMSDVFWQNSNGTIREWQMNGIGVSNAGTPGTNSYPAWHVVGIGDFDGNGKSDVFWQSDSGAVYEWLMNGMKVVSAGTPGRNTDPAWHIVGTGDFNGDGKSDVLWQGNDGRVYEWQMNGMKVAAAGFVGTNTDPAWHIVATGDFNGDGKTDIFWQNNNGAVREWQMNGFSATAGIPGTNTDPAWHVVGAGDFNGDGKSDILWQNDNGAVYEWQMNGMSVAAAGTPGLNTSPALHVAGIGDYNGDGKSDIFWQNDNGAVYEWQMNGMSVASAGTPGSNTTPAWHVATLG